MNTTPTSTTEFRDLRDGRLAHDDPPHTLAKGGPGLTGQLLAARDQPARPAGRP